MGLRRRSLSKGCCLLLATHGRRLLSSHSRARLLVLGLVDTAHSSHHIRVSLEGAHQLRGVHHRHALIHVVTYLRLESLGVEHRLELLLLMLLLVMSRLTSRVLSTMVLLGIAIKLRGRLYFLLTVRKSASITERAHGRSLLKEFALNSLEISTRLSLTTLHVRSTLGGSILILSRGSLLISTRLSTIRFRE